MLETKIENLTSAIERLIEALGNNQPQAEPAVEPKAKAPKAKAAAPTPPPTVNVDALQGRCLDLTRINRANGDKIREIVASYGVNLLKDIAPESLEEFAAKLEELA